MYLKIERTTFPARLLLNGAPLARHKLGYVGVVARRDVLVPALLDLILDHVVNVLGLGDAPRTIRAGDGVGEVHDAGEVGVVTLTVLRVADLANVPRFPRCRRCRRRGIARVTRVGLAVGLWNGARHR